MKQNVQTCPQCGGRTFYAFQSCRGSLSVIVTIDDAGVPTFQSNATEDGFPDASELDFDEPEGPFTCDQCGQELEL